MSVTLEDLLDKIGARIVTVRLETMGIVDALPALEIRREQ